MLRLATLMPLALVACVDSGDEGLYVLTNTAVTGTTCALDGSPDAAMLGHGIINAGSSLPYVMTPLVQSRLVAEPGIDEISRTVQLRGADVTLTLKAVSVENADGSFSTTQPNSMLGSPFSVLFSGAVPPGGSINAFLDIIPVSRLREVANMAGTGAISAEVLATVVVKGEVNGNSIESQPYLYPVTVCNDCIVNVVGACATFTGMARTGNACNPFQDGILDCCVADGGLVCPATATPP